MTAAHKHTDRQSEQLTGEQIWMDGQIEQTCDQSKRERERVVMLLVSNGSQERKRERETDRQTTSDTHNDRQTKRQTE